MPSSLFGLDLSAWSTAMLTIPRLRLQTIFRICQWLSVGYATLYKFEYMYFFLSERLIYLFKSQSVRKRKRHTDTGSLPKGPPEVRLGQTDGRSADSILAIHLGNGCFSGIATRSWMGSSQGSNCSFLWMQATQVVAFLLHNRHTYIQILN